MVSRCLRRKTLWHQEVEKTQPGIPFGRKEEACPVGLLKLWPECAGIQCMDRGRDQARWRGY